MAQTPSPTPTLQPTFTPPPTTAPTPGPTITVPEGLLTVTHAAAPNYVFAYDPAIWTVNDAADGTRDFLVNRNDVQCKVNLAAPPPEADVVTYYPEILGRRGWLVQQDAENTYYSHQNLTVQLLLNEDADCLAFQKTLLGDVYSLAEMNGAPAATPAVVPTQRPTPEGFVCQGALPPRLEEGDRVLVVAGFLWLRSEARVADETELKLFTRYPPAEIKISGAPVCVDKTVFFPVTVREFGPLGQILAGWMAESGNQVYFLDQWYLGW